MKQDVLIYFQVLGLIPEEHYTAKSSYLQGRSIVQMMIVHTVASPVK